MVRCRCHVSCVSRTVKHATFSLYIFRAAHYLGTVKCIYGVAFTLKEFPHIHGQYQPARLPPRVAPRIAPGIG